MNAGDGEHSYTKNSTYQKHSFDATKDAIKESILKYLDTNETTQLKTYKSSSSANSLSRTTLRIADLGCSSGPNTFYAMQAIVEAAIESKGLDHDLEFQAFFNDQTTNDFNTLFASLQNRNSDRRYFAAAVAGSFYDRLFPSSSIHVFYSVHALHWLSKAPDELLVRDSRSYNGGMIHYTRASEGVFDAYVAQFEKDLDAFLKARAQELVPGGIVMIIIAGTFDESASRRTSFGTVLFFLGTVLEQMVEEGLVKQSQVDAVNIRMMFPTVRQMKRVVERNGCFVAEKMELMEQVSDVILAREKIDMGIMHFRAGTEVIFVDHFGKEMANELFERAIQQKQRLSDLLGELSEVEGNPLIFALLKRKS